MNFDFTKEILETYELKSVDTCMIIGCNGIAEMYSKEGPELCLKCYGELIAECKKG